MLVLMKAPPAPAAIAAASASMTTIAQAKPVFSPSPLKNVASCRIMLHQLNVNPSLRTTAYNSCVKFDSDTLTVRLMTLRDTADLFWFDAFDVWWCMHFLSLTTISTCFNQVQLIASGVSIPALSKVKPASLQQVQLSKMLLRSFLRLILWPQQLQRRPPGNPHPVWALDMRRALTQLALGNTWPSMAKYCSFCSISIPALGSLHVWHVCLFYPQRSPRHGATSYMFWTKRRRNEPLKTNCKDLKTCERM